MGLDRSRILLLGLLAVVGVAFVGGSIDSATKASERAGGSGGSSLFGTPNESGALPVSEPPSLPTIPKAVLFAVYLLVALAVIRDVLDDPLKAVAIVLIGALVLALVMFGTGALPDLEREPPQQMNESNGTGAQFRGEGEAAQPGGTSPSEPSTTVPLWAIVAVGLLVVGSVLFLSTGGATTDDPDGEPPDDEDEQAAAVGRAAGDAADRIEGTEPESVENEVYRAWREMTGHLDVERPETSTPGEFVDAAVAAGLAADDVAELTRLFEEVRYGERDPTDRAERAVACLRRIEARYAEAES